MCDVFKIAGSQATLLLFVTMFNASLSCDIKKNPFFEMDWKKCQCKVVNDGS